MDVVLYSQITNRFVPVWPNANRYGPAWIAAIDMVWPIAIAVGFAPGLSPRYPVTGLGPAMLGYSIWVKIFILFHCWSYSWLHGLFVPLYIIIIYL